MKKRLISFLLVITIVFGCVACAGPVVSPEPTDPTVSSTAPTDPGSPTDPTEPSNPTDPSDPADPSDPTDPTDPTEPSNPTDPSDPSDPADPSDPTDPTDPTDPANPTNPSDPADPSDPTEPMDPIVPDVPAVNPDADPEEIFTKTVHDFDGYRVENLDDQEDTNFVVYAKGVQVLTSTATSNVLQSVDENTLTYTFKNPDAAMKALKPGDVFYVPVSEHCPDGASVKVKSISLSGDTAVIQGDEMAMSDLFVYIDAADISLDQIPVKVEQPSVATRIPLEMDKTVPLADRTFTLPLSFTAGTGAPGNEDAGAGSSISASMDIKYRLTQNKMTLRYSVFDLYFEYGLQSRVITNSHMSLQCKGFVKASKDLPLAKITTPIPGVFFMVDLSGAIEGSVQINGVWDYTEINDVGMKYSLDQPDVIQSWTNEVDASNTETDLEIEGTIDISAGIKFGLGVPEVFGGYVQPTVGYKLNGKMTFPGDDIVEPDAECIHGCDKCIEGKLTGYLNASFGIESKPFAEKLGLEFDASISTPDLEFATKDFYCAFPKNTDFEFDWGKCPYKRWRTEVTVENQDGTKVSGATVEATFADGCTDEGTTDGNGMVVLYLPNGKSVVQCTYEQMEKEEDVTVDDAPETVEFLIKDEIPIYYERSILTDDDVWKSIEPMILSVYPNAIDYEYFDSEVTEAIRIYVNTEPASIDSEIIDKYRILIYCLSEGHWNGTTLGGGGRLSSAWRNLSTSYDSGQELFIEYILIDGIGRIHTVEEIIYVSDTSAYDPSVGFGEQLFECMNSLQSRLLSDLESDLRRLSEEIDRLIENVYK